MRLFAAFFSWRLRHKSWSRDGFSPTIVASTYQFEQINWICCILSRRPFCVDFGVSMTKEPKVEPAKAEARLAPRDTFRILLVDSVENTDLLKVVCKNAGYDVVAANSLPEAFAFLDDKDHADVIVCADYLHDGTMLPFLKRLKENPIHKDAMFMILALSASYTGIRVNESTETAGRLLGADAFVSMPVFDADIFLAEIKKLLPPLPSLEVSKLKGELG